jgi:hypothetical protein
MDSSTRVKLLVAALGLVFLGSVAYLFFQGNGQEEAAKEQAPGGTGKSKLVASDRPRCPDCGKELPATGDCPFCLMKKKTTGAGGVDPPSRSGRILAWSLIGSTVVLGAAHLAMILRARRRFLRPPDEGQLKTRCPFCKRRVRFAARLADLPGTCPTCKKSFTFKPERERYP